MSPLPRAYKGKRYGRLRQVPLALHLSQTPILSSPRPPGEISPGHFFEERSSRRARGITSRFAPSFEREDFNGGVNYHFV